MDTVISIHCVYVCTQPYTELWLYHTYPLWASWYSLKFLANWSVSWCSVQFCHSLMSNSLWPHGPQHAGLPVHHQLLGSTQTHVHWVSDAIQPSHPVSSPSPSALSLSQLGVFSNESALRIRWPKYWSFSFNITPPNENPALISFSVY